MEKKPLSKEELIEQLKAIAKKKDIKPYEGNVMCYCISPPKKINISCDCCGKKYPTTDWTYNDIWRNIHSIRDLGYEADVEVVCTNCFYSFYKDSFEEIDLESYDILFEEDDSNIRLYYLFKFKARGQEKWHVAISNNSDDYKAVVAFLRNKPTYDVFYKEVHFIKDELSKIERMTGISIK